MGTKYRVRIGRSGEEFAEKLMNELGYITLCRNFRCKTGEIDLICRKGMEVHFVEVKTRFSNSNGHPEEAVTDKKIDSMRKAAEFYLSKNRISGYTYVFDVVAIEVGMYGNCA